MASKRVEPWRTMSTSKSFYGFLCLALFPILCGCGSTGPNPVSNFQLTVQNAGAGGGTITSNLGGINCGQTCSASIAPGTSVALTATPNSGSTFGGWSGACSGTGTCTVVI